MSKILKTNKENEDAIDSGQLAIELIADLRNKIDADKIKTGFRDFDKYIGGFRFGEFIVIGSRPGIGKTQFLVNLALNISITHPVLFFTFDLSTYYLTRRFVSCLSNIPIRNIIEKDVSAAEMEQLSAHCTEFGNRPIMISQTGNHSVEAMIEVCEKYILEYDVKVIFIDPLQGIYSHRHSCNRDSELDYICKELKKTAKKFNVCIVVTSQLSRAVECRAGAREPMLSDLRDSGSIEQEADKVIFIYRKEYYGILEDEQGSTVGQIELLVQKNRQGYIGVVRIERSTNFSQFRDRREIQQELYFSSKRIDEIINE